MYIFNVVAYSRTKLLCICMYVCAYVLHHRDVYVCMYVFMRTGIA